MFNEKVPTTYKGKPVTLAQLAKRFKINPNTIQSRWRAAGRPVEIPESMLKPAVFQNKTPITLDGQRISIKDLATKFRIQEQSVRKQLERHGRTLTSEQFRGGAISSAPVVRYQHPEDRSPGWLERKMFPAAGDNGFCKVERSNPDCCGMLANVPCAGDMP